MSFLSDDHDECLSEIPSNDDEFEGKEGMNVTNRDHMVVENTLSRVKLKSKLTNFKINLRIEGYNGKYYSNPQRIRKIFYDLFEFDQIE